MAINPNRRKSLLLLVCDFVMVIAIFNVVALLRGVISQPQILPFLGAAVVFSISLHLIDGYGANSDMLSLDYASLHLIASFFAALTTFLLTFVFVPAGFELQSSRITIALGFGVLGPASLGLRRILYERSNVSRGERKIIFIGETADFEGFSAECSRMGTTRPLVHADLAQDGQVESVLASAISTEIQVEAIVVKESIRELPPDVPSKLVQLYFDGVPTYTLELFHQAYWRKIPLYRINPVWLFQEGFKVAREPVFERIKRALDILLSVFGLIVSLPIVAVAAVAIKLDDRGPVFFTQRRIGQHKVPFMLVKLRTMTATQAPGDLYTRQNDARITRVGSLLRKSRMDELPQLWNVLRGEMSIIGPRAEWDRLVAEYERDIPCYHFRHLVKPGITGWAQVNYRYGQGVEDTLRKLEYDLYYIRNYSFMLDASIVLKTLHVMLLRKGH